MMSLMRIYAVRGALLWVGSRALLSCLLLLAHVDPMELSVAATMSLVVGTVVLGYADISRRHERILLGNLGITHGMLVMFFALPALFGEIIVRVGWELTR
jgi:hypothetical protein